MAMYMMFTSKRDTHGRLIPTLFDTEKDHVLSVHVRGFGECAVESDYCEVYLVDNRQRLCFWVKNFEGWNVKIPAANDRDVFEIIAAENARLLSSVKQVVFYNCYVGGEALATRIGQFIRQLGDSVSEIVFHSCYSRMSNVRSYDQCAHSLFTRDLIAIIKGIGTNSTIEHFNLILEKILGLRGLVVGFRLLLESFHSLHDYCFSIGIGFDKFPVLLTTRPIAKYLRITDSESERDADTLNFFGTPTTVDMRMLMKAIAHSSMRLFGKPDGANNTSGHRVDDIFKQMISQNPGIAFVAPPSYNSFREKIDDLLQPRPRPESQALLNVGTEIVRLWYPRILEATQIKHENNRRMLEEILPPLSLLRLCFKQVERTSIQKHSEDASAHQLSILKATRKAFEADLAECSSCASSSAPGEDPVVRDEDIAELSAAVEKIDSAIEIQQGLYDGYVDRRKRLREVCPEHVEEVIRKKIRRTE